MAGSGRESVRTDYAVLLRSLVTNAPIVLFTIDRTGVYTLHEGKGLEAVGLRPGQLVGAPMIVRHRDQPAGGDPVQEALAGATSTGEVELAGRVFELVLVPLRDSMHEVVGATGVAVDVTDRRAGESALRRREARFRGMIENGAEGMWLLGHDGSILYASPAAGRILGYTPAELVGTQASQLVEPADLAALQVDAIRLASEPARTALQEFRMRHRSGAVLWMEGATAHWSVDPTLGAYVSNFRDITARKQVEDSLHESQRLLREAQSVAQLGFWSAGESSIAPITWSSECARIFGLDDSSAPSLFDLSTRIMPDDRAAVIEAWRQAVSSQQSCDVDFRIVRPDGAVRWVRTRSIVEGALFGVVQDITERRQIEDQLHASDARYRRMVESITDGIWMFDAIGTTTFVNPQLATLLHCTVADVTGRPIFEFVEGEALEVSRRKFADLQRGMHVRTELQLRRHDGTELWAYIRAEPQLDASGRFESAVAVVSDITERRRGDATRMLLASIVASSQDAIIGRGTDGVIQTWNRGAEELMLYTAAEAIGQPISILYPAEDRPALEAMRRRLEAGEQLSQYQVGIIRKDGTRTEVSVTSSLLTGDDGRTLGVSIVARDISERLRAEAALQKTEQQLRQAMKMEAVGNLAGGIAHDFNNLLTVILSYTEMFIEDIDPSDPRLPDLEQVRKAGERATELTRQLLAFSRKQILQPVVLEINDVVHKLHRMLHRVLGEDIELAIVLAANAGKVHADAGQIEQVLMNLVVNARDAMPTGGRLTIETANVDLTASTAAVTDGMRADRYVRVTVTDTGIGMDATTKSRVFEPFFTTKEPGKGTGLGLSTVYGIVQQSGGQVTIESALGAGTSFHIYLPRTDRSVDLQEDLDVVPTSLRGTETILVVDDDDAMRATIRTILHRNGYTVLEASNAGEALLVTEAHPTQIHLLLTDVVMPRMSGRQLAGRLTQLRPDLKVLFVSGYTEDTIFRHGVLDAELDFLAKPLRPNALLKKIRLVLDPRRRRTSVLPPVH